MAKRFTDTSKWSKPFIRGLNSPYKLLWLYILDECDHAGIWQVDIDVAQVKLGVKISHSDALQYFEGKICEISNGEKWFIPDFIEFQYGELNPDNRAHASVIKLLNYNNIDPSDISTLQGANKGLTRGYYAPKDKDKDKDKVKDKDKDKNKDGQNLKNKPHLFSESEFIDFNKFESAFIGSDYEFADLRIYYESVKNWSAANNQKKIDWIATARNFIISDFKQNKITYKNGAKPQPTISEKERRLADLQAELERRYGKQ